MNIFWLKFYPNKEVIKMCLIPCDSDCAYQEDGYCTLNAPALITNDTNKGCVHYIKFNSSKKEINCSKPQKLGGYF